MNYYSSISNILGILIILLNLIAILNNHRNYLLIIISLELILISISYLFISFALLFDDFIGILSTILILVIGAADTAIGLTLLMLIP